MENTTERVHATSERKPVWPESFQFPPVPFELVEGLDDTLSKLIREYLPPVWADAVITWGICYAARLDDTHNSMADYAGWVKDLDNLLDYLAGVRRDKEGKIVEFVAPAPKLREVE